MQSSSFIKDLERIDGKAILSIIQDKQAGYEGKMQLREKDNQFRMLTPDVILSSISSYSVVDNFAS